MNNNELQPTTVWYSIRNGGDGSAYPHWFLTEEDAERDQENMDEGWGEPCTGSVETYEGSDIWNEAIENSKEFEGKHEYLKEDDFYEMNHVGSRARSSYFCEHCRNTIPQGEPHLIAKFYPEFQGYRLHEKCEQAFMDSLN
jgi:hypothetical protein